MIFYSPELDEICFVLGLRWDGEKAIYSVAHEVGNTHNMDDSDWHFVGFL